MKNIMISTIVFLILFIFFLFTRQEKIIFSNNKLNKNYIKIYSDDKNVVLSEFIDIEYITKNDKKYTLKEALEKIINLEDLYLKSSRKKILYNSTVYYFDNKSKIKTKLNFQMVICNTNIIYITTKFNEFYNNMCTNHINIS